MLFSASDVIKFSASKIVYISKHGKKDVTIGQLQGESYAEKHSLGLKEMRGCFSFDDDKVFFSFDEIRVCDLYYFIEHKSIDKSRNLEDWYFKSSTMQVAFYSALYRFSNVKTYETATFYKEKTNENNVLSLKDVEYNKCRFLLNFGGDIYEIILHDDRSLMKFFYNKMKSCYSYDSAKQWDNFYKNKEYEYVKSFYSIRKMDKTIIQMNRIFKRKNLFNRLNKFFKSNGKV